VSTRRLLAFAFLCACGDGELDPLDPDVIDMVGKSGGDAEGDARSGAYVLNAAGARACDCPTVQGFDLCEIDVTQIRDDAVVTFDQSDGYLLLTPAAAPGTLALSGSLDADGAFDLAGVYDLGSIFADVTLTTRLSGEFTGATRFTALLRTRIRGTLEADEIDCRTELDVTGERQQAP
jgi:hypothetical protein